jgi:hypothetical protein
MEKMGYSVHFIPNPVNTRKIEFQEQKINAKIVIFSWYNRSSYIKKGISYFEKALQIIQEKYAEIIAVIITETFLMLTIYIYTIVHKSF